MVGYYNYTALHVSAAFGRLHVLQYFLEKSLMDNDLIECNGRTLLSIAAYEGHLSCVKYLLKIGCKHYDKHQDTALHRATAGGHLDIVKYLMDHHSNMYSLNPFLSPLFVAIKYNHLDIIKYFIDDKKCDPYITMGEPAISLLQAAAGKGQTELVRYFVEDVKLDYLMQDKQTLCPQLCAAMNGHVETFDYFVTELKCDINTPGQVFLPIHFAAAHGHLNFVKYLLKQPDCDVIGYSKGAPFSCLHIAAAGGHLDVVQCLIREIDPFLPDQPTSQDTPIHYAATFDQLEVVKFFVSTYGSKSLLIRNYLGQTPLNVALSNNSHLTALYLTTKTFMLL